MLVLAFFLFTPMTVPSYVWWSAGLNSLPMQFAMAWLIGDAVLLCRGGVSTRLIVVRSSLIYLAALACFEKSLYILPVVFLSTVLWCRFGRVRTDRGSSSILVRSPRHSSGAAAVASAGPTDRGVGGGLPLGDRRAGVPPGNTASARRCT